MTTGFDKGGFSGIVGLEFLDQRPLWGTDRKVQDSTLDAPTENSRRPRLIAQRYNWDDDVNFAPTGGCSALSALNGGTTVLANNNAGEPYCGSDRAIAYRTIENERKGVNAYGSFQYAFSDTLSWFADTQVGLQKVKLLTGTGGNGTAGGRRTAISDHMGWQFTDPNSTGNYRNPAFYNAGSGAYEMWFRQFAPEEIGGLRNRMNSTTEKTLSVTTGLKGMFGDGWNWEAAYNHSQYKADVRMPRIKAAEANQLFLGDRLGYDADGYAIYDPDPARLFTPITPAQFASIAAMSTFRPKAENDNLSFTTDTSSLFSMPAGDVGFAGVVEYGSQSYRINPDPLALLDDVYTGPRYGDGHGDRDHWDAAGELRVPLLSSLQGSVAGRYDRYSYGGQNPGKFTWSTGLEWRPLDTLLVRGSYGTGFRAPDMHYLFAGDDYYRRVSTDYYHCRTDEPGFSNGHCYDDGSWDISTRDIYHGNRNLHVETSKSFTAGLVWSPADGLDLGLDYYKIRVSNQVQTQDRDLLLIADADCRLGMTTTGTPVDINSPTCVDAMARVVRDADGDITRVLFEPINIANEKTSGVDLTASYRLETANAGVFRFRGSYTWVHRHSFEQYPGDPSENMLDYRTYSPALPRAKGNLGVSWDRNAFGASLFGTYLGRVPNYDDDAWTHATWRFNASARYDINDHFRLALSIDNLFDQMPPKDSTWTPYPYYDSSWFDAIGRSYYLQLTYKFGGSALSH